MEVKAPRSASGSCCSRAKAAGATLRTGWENTLTGQLDRLKAST